VVGRAHQLGQGQERILADAVRSHDPEPR
jgi:hypothetical protein